MLNKNKFFSILIISLFLISCIIGFYTPKVKATTATEQIINGGFDDGGFNGWNNIGAILDSTNTAYSGTYSAFHCSAPSELGVTQVFATGINSNSVTEFSFWVHTISSGSNLGLCVVYYSDSSVSNIFLNDSGSYLSWTQVDATSNILPNKIITSIAFSNGNGYYDLDNVVLMGILDTGIETITLSSVGSGSISGYDYTTATVLNSGVNYVAVNDSINVHATSDEGSQFFYFLVNGVEYVNGAFDKVVVSDLTVVSYFRSLPSSVTYTLTVTNPNVAGGDVSWYDTNNGSTPSFSTGIFTDIPVSDGLEFTAHPNTGYSFVDWYVTNTTDGSYISSFTTSPLNMGFAEDVTVYPEWILNSLNTPTPNTAFGLGTLGISNTEIAVGIYVVSIIGMCYAFFLMHNSNIPFAVCLGLIVATVICQIINILGIYTYPIDVLITISVVGIIIFMRH